MKELIGLTIKKVYVEKGENAIFFGILGSNTYIQFDAEGDCCSESWFSDIYNFDALIDGTVITVVEKELPDYNTEDGKCRQDADSVYGYGITTDKGVAVIVFRNSSNGYYGGWVDKGNFCTELPANVVEITGDWNV